MLHYVSYPFIAKSKGLSHTEVGIIMGVFPFVNILTFPISGVLTNKMNVQLTFAISSLVQCILFSLFAFVPSMERIPFEIYSFLFPIIFSFPVSFFYNSTYALLQQVFPRHATLILTIQYVFFSSAYLMGPPVGSILYDKIGFMNMFLDFSAAGILLSFVAILILYFSPINTKIKKKIEKPESFLIFRILSTPSISLNLLFTFLSASYYFYFLPVIGPYLASRYGVSIVTVGLLFMVAEVSHLVIALPLGYVLNRSSNPPYYFIIMSGIIIHAIGIFLYAPSSILFSLSGNFLPICFVGSSCIGIGFALAYVPTMSVSLNRGQNTFPSCPTSTNTIISGLMTGTYSIGESFGPIVGGIISEFIRLDVTTFYLSLSLASVSILAFIAMFFNREHELLFNLIRKQFSYIVKSEDAETLRLIK
ncbi:hypothetical protein LOD99_10406 [Oopsacas minuta]|uniref:Major facilitator superfamily (MFS) profile domain-containing protein n=1 Tax=Oopsacas minuta TaxID=111878 RepID=A0AAV7KG48_9METZ|nr:hypothetical protein LOD99_10406 [Oopsacas minuta]